MAKIKTTKYEITPEIKELQKLASKLIPHGHRIDIDITKDLVTFNGIRKMNREEAKKHMLQMIENNKNPIGSRQFPDQEEIKKEQKRKERLARQNRKPGEPPETKALIRRAKRVWKKCFIKTNNSATAMTKADGYINRKGTDENKPIAHQALLSYVNKEMSK